MARYTGPKTKIARKFGEAIFGQDQKLKLLVNLAKQFLEQTKASKKEIILQGSMEMQKEEVRNLNMLSS